MADVRPIVSISMGDPFGNGPEISVKSLADKTLYDRCKPLIVGDKSSMEYALAVARKVSGIDLKLTSASFTCLHTFRSVRPATA